MLLRSSRDTPRRARECSESPFPFQQKRCPSTAQPKGESHGTVVAMASRLSPRPVHPAPGHLRPPRRGAAETHSSAFFPSRPGGLHSSIPSVPLAPRCTQRLAAPRLEQHEDLDDDRRRSDPDRGLRRHRHARGTSILVERRRVRRVRRVVQAARGVAQRLRGALPPQLRRPRGRRRRRPGEAPPGGPEPPGAILRALPGPAPEERAATSPDRGQPVANGVRVQRHVQGVGASRGQGQRVFHGG